MIDTDRYDLTPARTQDDDGPVVHAAADPADALRTLIQRRQAFLHQESADLKSLQYYADRLADRLPPGPADPERRGDSGALTGSPTVAARLDAVLRAAEAEVLVLDRSTCRPDAPGADREAGVVDCDRIRELLARGVSVRTVTDRRSTDFPDRAKALVALTELGLQARIGLRLPTGMVLVDRSSCLLLPSDGDGAAETAHVLGGLLLHHVALPLFESLWARATPVGSAGSPLTADQRELLGLLASGLKDESIARRLGVHVHTARRRISRMLEELDADTRFQAGVQAGFRGWLRPAP
ncbi:helix-turn-helix transcriptional regulator [Streptomyces sp. NRRL S-87]|uniref:helix-turn-helix transcriptional regulator n=1 Tax=Streptomyces sp. NRRL S-87 TaxID=1463920 RepID=UPI00068D3792|nr:helix-turn-helix transcriptional regulator [Streptomyces sp. NRRL S-87]